jgi:putative Holliday junction resolvase
MVNEQLLGLDIGKVRSGIARASSLARLAEPLMTVETANLIETLEELIKEHNYSVVVVGLPRNLQGDETPQTEWVRHWTDKAKKKLATEFYWQDEALTTKMAEAHQLANGRQIAEGTDALAAAIILQDFLDTPEANRVGC